MNTEDLVVKENKKENDNTSLNIALNRKYFRKHLSYYVKEKHETSKNIVSNSGHTSPNELERIRNNIRSSLRPPLALNLKDTRAHNQYIHR